MNIALEWVRFLTASLFILSGVGTIVLSVLGVFKFHFVLNRMHSAAMGDTMGLLMVLTGLIIISGFSFLSLKILLVICFLWMASPVSSHLITRLEITTDKQVKEECEEEEL